MLFERFRLTLQLVECSLIKWWNQIWAVIKNPTWGRIHLKFWVWFLAIVKWSSFVFYCQNFKMYRIKRGKLNTHLLRYSIVCIYGFNSTWIERCYSSSKWLCVPKGAKWAIRNVVSGKVYVYARHITPSLMIDVYAKNVKDGGHIDDVVLINLETGEPYAPSKCQS